MSAATMVHLLSERFYWGRQQRVPEPDLVMESEAQTSAFSLAGEQNGVLAFLYLYNALQISTMLRTGDRVLDLACGPANQLMHMARLNPAMHFTGVDASQGMLQYAQRGVARAQLDNVELQYGDITRLEGVADASIDCITCTMSLHHLPDPAALQATMREIRRVLKADGRYYLVDFGRFKLRSTQRFFANELQQSVQFTEDYFNSLRAAFSVDELVAAAGVLGADLQTYVTVLAPFMVTLRSPFRQSLDGPCQQRAQQELNKLSAAQQNLYRNIEGWFKLAGYAPPCALDARPSR